ncbi:hypothetical protein AB0O20_06680 [Streptomyces kronopolitis]|uniref:hypothetical protein n=1 Tax=Streptomyces kronopolitis TaxID=1612435 RepID=UPI00343C87FB
MSILPINTPVWVAQAADPQRRRRALAGDGVVVSHVPCSACWQRHVGGGRHITRRDYTAVQAGCREPIGFVATVRGLPVTVLDGDDTVLAVPIVADERSAA